MKYEIFTYTVSKLGLDLLVNADMNLWYNWFFNWVRGKK